jgi:sugar phosphate isomerase/epimerase
MPNCYNPAMSRLAFSTNAFKKNTLEEAIRAIAQIGYEGVELMADVPHAYPPSMDAAARSKLAALIKSLGLSVSNINAFTLFAAGDTYHPSWIEEQVGKRKRRVEHTLGCIELASQMGSKSISLEPGGPMIGTDISRKVAGERFAEGIEQVLPAAQKYGVVLAIEPEPGLFIETSAEYVQFKERYFKNEPLIQMNCDIGHLFCAGEDPAATIRAMPNEIAHVHLEDIGENRVHQHLAPGKGAIDFTPIFSSLRDISYRGWVTVELYPYETTAAGVAKAAWDYLRNFR